MYSLTDRKTIEYLCNKYDFKFKKGLGQNFLTDESVLINVAEAAEIEDGGVLEIGPGFGVLTAVLAQRAKKVLAVEIDEKVMPVLAETLAGFDNIEIVNKDILKCDVSELIHEHFGDEKISVAANLPYYITTPVIMKLLEEHLPLSNIAVMVQKEVAERMCAAPGGKEYGAVTVAVNYYCEPSLVCNVGRHMFVPAPNVDSAVLKLKLREKPPVCVISEKTFFSVVKAAFSQRRKTLFNALKNSGNFGSAENIDNVLNAAGIDKQIRGERLSIEEFAKIANGFCKAD